MYEALSGMTGTALSSEEEFFTVYGLEVVVVPTHRPVKRKDHDDLIFQTAHGKYLALVREVKKLYEKGQPVLIGTVAIEDNEIVSRYLTDAHIPHEVLNAKNHEREGEIIAQAGRRGTVTVATNLAGRGVDIKLGGVPVDEAAYTEVVALGGLAVIGTERHEARRIDNQLRGRSGRQGDPGETLFLISLEDKLMRVFASDMIKNLMGTFKIPEDEPIQSGLITRSLETAQKRIEGFNFDARKQVLAYDDVLNAQRLSIYKKRNIALTGTPEELQEAIMGMLEEDTKAKEAYEEKGEELGEEVRTALMRRLLLQITDALWLEHLETMEYLRRSVSLRAYGQRDPLIEYRKEGLARFKALEEHIRHGLREALPRIKVADDARIRQEEERTRKALVAASESKTEETAQTPIVKGDTPNRNDMVTIRKGKETQTLKYKKAEPLLSEGWELVS
jgi:preprotein translocase subunit SecA